MCVHDSGRKAWMHVSYLQLTIQGEKLTHWGRCNQNPIETNFTHLIAQIVPGQQNTQTAHTDNSRTGSSMSWDDTEHEIFWMLCLCVFSPPALKLIFDCASHCFADYFVAYLANVKK